MDGIAKTSLLVAAMRAAETQRSESEGRLFMDPFAEKLAGSEGAALLQKAIAESGDQPAITIRTRFIDEKVLDAVNSGIRQIVMLAAGMDARAYRLSLPKDTRIFELDRPEVLNYKNEKLATAQPLCTRIPIAADLREEWTGLLRQAGFNEGEPTLWMVEGLLMYLSEGEVSSLFERINQLVSPQDRMVFDILSRTLLGAPHMKKQLHFLESLGAPWKFGTDEPEAFMARFGWTATMTQAGEFMPSRWPFPTAPRSVPNIPRGFFAEARRA